MVDLDKLWSYSGLKRLKTDQVLPVSIFVAPSLIDPGGVCTHIKARKTETARAKVAATAPAASAAIEPQAHLLVVLINIIQF